METSTALKQLILLKEAEREAEGKLLKAHFRRTYESLKPMNIMKSTFKEIVSAPDLKTDVINAAIGFSTGFVAKKILLGETHNPFAKLIGFVVEMLVANKVVKNAEGIKSLGSLILKKIMKRQDDLKK